MVYTRQYYAGRPKTSLNSAALRRPAPESPIANTTCSTSPRAAAARTSSRNAAAARAGEGRRDHIYAPYYELGCDYFLVNVRPEIVFFSLGASDASAARFSTWSQPLTLRRMRMWRFVFAALMW